MSVEIFHGLFNQEKSKEKHDQNNGRARLNPKLLFPKEVDDEIHCQVGNDQMIDNGHHSHIR